MKANQEQHAFKCLRTITGGFVDDRLIAIGDTKTVAIGDQVFMSLNVLDMDSVKNLFLIRIFDDKDLESYVWKVQVYHHGFARAITFEQHGVIVLRADREGVDRVGDNVRDYETFARINSFFQESLDASLNDFLKGAAASRLGKVA